MSHLLCIAAWFAAVYLLARLARWIHSNRRKSYFVWTLNRFRAAVAYEADPGPWVVEEIPSTGRTWLDRLRWENGQFLREVEMQDEPADPSED